MSQMNCIPVELLLRIFSSLPYSTLLTLTGVCRLWREIVQDDPYLRVRMLKSPSLCGELFFTFPQTGLRSARGNGEEIKIHPALQKASYRMGEAIDTAGFHLGNIDPLGRFKALIGLEVSTDYATMPPATEMHLEVMPHSPANPCLPRASCSLLVDVSNPEGVRVIDVFAGLVRESCLQCDLLALASGGVFYQRVKNGQKINLSKKAEVLGTFKCYAGLANVRREDSHIFAHVLAHKNRV